MRTWLECLLLRGCDDWEVVCSEFNARAHGASSSQAYPKGLLQNAVKLMERVFDDRAYGLAWFLDDAYGNKTWEGESLKSGIGNMRLARDDFYELQAAG